MSSVNITEIFNLLYSMEPVSKVAMQPKGGFSYVFEPDPTCKQKEGTWNFNLVDYLDIYSMIKFIQTGGKTDGTGDKIVRTFTPSQLKAVIIRLRK